MVMKTVCVVGASNIDIQGRPWSKLVARDSNIGTVRFSPGGVGRNIAENLARLSVRTRLISAVGNDAYGLGILEDARKLGLDMSGSLIAGGRDTSVYLCILDEANDMALAINDMALSDAITIDFIESRRRLIEDSAVCVLDTNFSEDVLGHLLQSFQDTVFFLDPVSAAKADKVREHVGRFHTIKPNRLEAEVLSGIPIRTDSDLVRAAALFHREGVRQVFVTLGRDGVFCSTPEGSLRLPAPNVTVKSATGAGDAFTAGLVLGYLRGLDAGGSARLASAAAAVTLSGEGTINPSMSAGVLAQKAKELGLC